MSESHTPGRLAMCGPDDGPDGRVWRLNGRHQPEGFSGARDCRLADVFSVEANARRLVACWNACEGVSTDYIEAGIGGVNAKAELVRERDELLAALRAVNDAQPGAFQCVTDALAKHAPRVPA